MKSKVLCVLSMFVVLFFINCGGGSDPEPTEITATLAPINGAIDQSKNASVTATFSGEVETPTEDNFELIECENEDCTETVGENLCTVAYESLIATCEHDDFKELTWYRAKISGVKGGEGQDVADEQSIFQTGLFSVVTITLSPVDGATDQLRNVVVKVTAVGGSFGEKGEQPETAKFELKKDGTGDDLCTDFELSVGNTVLTCTHSSLGYGSEYEIVASGLLDSYGRVIDEATATFSTVAGTSVTVTDMQKTSVLTESGGEYPVTFTFSFSGAIDDNPEVTVDGGDSFSCVLNDDKDGCSAEINVTTNCGSFTDYEIELTGSLVETYTYTMNSADDEFDDDQVFEGGVCYRDQVISSGYCKIITDGTLTPNLTKVADDISCDYKKTRVANTDVAFTIRTISNDAGEPVGVGDDKRITSYIMNDGAGGDEELHISNGYITAIGELNPNWILLDQRTGGGPTGVGLNNSVSVDTPYVCVVRYDDTVKFFLSDDGITFSQITSDDITVIIGEITTTDFDVSAWASPNALAILQARNDIAGDYAPVFDYFRFRSSGLTGTAADCPKLR